MFVLSPYGGVTGLRTLPHILIIFFCCVGVSLRSTQAYATQADDTKWSTMVTSYYGIQHHKKEMARGGHLFDRFNATIAAHWTLPINTKLLVLNPRNGHVQVVCIRDRGPDPNTNRHLDVSEAAAKHLGIITQGVVSLKTRVIGMCQPYQWGVEEPLVFVDS